MHKARLLLLLLLQLWMMHKRKAALSIVQYAYADSFIGNDYRLIEFLGEKQNVNAVALGFGELKKTRHKSRNNRRV